ncbi:hypothetical protein ACFFYR_06135 [Paraburkholderia dipogonis]|uniref:hypothetical protein n=1 Tax=Paraburkholderia dipogonis TaxID=1211383 RepID=UPI0035E783CA
MSADFVFELFILIIVNGIIIACLNLAGFGFDSLAVGLDIGNDFLRVGSAPYMGLTFPSNAFLLARPDL